VAKDGPFSIPTVKGRIAEKLKKASPRVDEGEEELEFPPAPAEISLRTPEERGVAALACLILENLREHGGTRAPKRPLETVLRKTLATFGPKEVMDIEVEAYEILLWLGNAIDPEWSKQATSEVGGVSEESSYDDLIRWAIGGNHDLEMDYYSRGRGELTHRRVTPISLEAETYCHAYCHLRRDERVFRLTRIADLRPVGGWSKHRTPNVEPAKKKEPQEAVEAVPKSKKTAKNNDTTKPDETPDDNPQMSLLDG
jgi:predicted DNA-binding transcriptional regulator YafY